MCFAFPPMILKIMLDVDILSYLPCVLIPLNLNNFDSGF